jgi:hypothetical protein
VANDPMVIKAVEELEGQAVAAFAKKLIQITGGARD